MPRCQALWQTCMTLKQQQDRLTPGSLQLQRRGLLIKQLMQRLKLAMQLDVLQHAERKRRHALTPQLKLVQHPTDLGVIRVKRTVTPALLMGLGASVQLIRIDQHHAARRRQMITAAMTKALRAVLDHGEYKTLVHMRRKPLLDVMRVQQLNPAQLG